jgi:hypothetical protein
LINEIWDRIEKGLYLLVDAALNWYFLKTVKANLISNGLTKYNKLVRFNQRIVVLSLLMDVMIIGAMSIPNSFVYALHLPSTLVSTANTSSRYIQFHPLAYLVKLNIEMTMANLIKRIAVSTSRRTGKASLAQEFKSSSNLSTSGKTNGTIRHSQRGSLHELSSIVSYVEGKAGNHERIMSFAPTGNQIKTTQEVTVTSEPNPFFERGRRGSEVEITGAYHGNKTNIPGIIVEEAPASRKSLESNTEVAESLKSTDLAAKRLEDSDDEAALVDNKVRYWSRGPGSR